MGPSVETARRENKVVTIDVTVNGQQLFHAALPGTSPDNDQWVQRKNRVDALLGFKWGGVDLGAGVLRSAGGGRLKNVCPSANFGCERGADWT